MDAKTFGLYGGSYGGFITLMAMFAQPDVFTAGAALRPVRDWTYYNQQYSGSILNQPLKNSEAYRQSSPIYFSGGLKGQCEESPHASLALAKQVEPGRAPDCRRLAGFPLQNVFNRAEPVRESHPGAECLGDLSGRPVSGYPSCRYRTQ